MIIIDYNIKIITNGLTFGREHSLLYKIEYNWQKKEAKNVFIIIVVYSLIEIFLKGFIMERNFVNNLNVQMLIDFVLPYVICIVQCKNECPLLKLKIKFLLTPANL